MNIQIIQAFGLGELNEKVQEFCQDKTILSTNINVVAMCDYYDNMPDRVCNRWNEYFFTIVYE